MYGRYPSEARVGWVKRNIGMVVNTGAQIWWTFETLDVLGRVRSGDKMGMKNFAVSNHHVLNDLIAEVLPPRHRSHLHRRRPIASTSLTSTRTTTTSLPRPAPLLGPSLLRTAP